MASETPACPDCGLPVIRALTEERRWQLLNPDPDDTGRVAAAPDATGTWHARTLIADQRPAALEKRFLPHYATSPACRDASRRRQAQPWRRLLAATAARQRGQRGRHAAPKITGYRIPPPTRRKESP